MVLFGTAIATYHFVSAYYYPQWTIHYRKGKIPVSVRGKIEIWGGIVLNNAVGGLARLVGPQIAALTFSGIGVDAPFFSAGLMVLPAIFFAWYAATHKSRTALSDQAAEPRLPEN